MGARASLKVLAFNVLKELVRRRPETEKCPARFSGVGHLGTPPAPAAARLAAPPQLPEAIPAGAVLLAPRYDGVGRPLAEVPECWCCATPWRLERLQEYRGKTYAFLEPGCACLDARACYGCFVCRDHCRCHDAQGEPNKRATR